MALIGSVTFGASFNLVSSYTRWTTVICGTLKNGSLQINSLASNRCFSSETSSNMASTLYQNGFKNPTFCQISKFCIVPTIRFCSIFILFTNSSIRIRQLRKFSIEGFHVTPSPRIVTASAMLDFFRYPFTC